MDADDIAIPPPRTAKAWVCTNCASDRGVPDEGYFQMDRRYALGHCSGCHKRVTLVADFAFDREEWDRLHPPKDKNAPAHHRWAGDRKVKPPKGPKEKKADAARRRAEKAK